MVRVKSVHSGIGQLFSFVKWPQWDGESGDGKVKCVHSGIGEPILDLVCAQWYRPAILICKMAQWDGDS